MDTTGQYSRVSSCCNSCILVQYQVHRYIISNIIGGGERETWFLLFLETLQKRTECGTQISFFFFFSFLFSQPTQEKVIEKPRLFYSVTFRSEAESLVLPSSLGWSTALGKPTKWAFPLEKYWYFYCGKDDKNGMEVVWSFFIPVQLDCMSQ